MAKELTIKQEKFCQKYLECGNASEAYRFAYDAEKMSSNTVKECASRLLNNRNVSATVDALRSKSEKKFEISKDRLLREAVSIALSPISDKISARDKISAIATVNKMQGYDAPSQSEIKLTNELERYSDEELYAIANGRSGK